MLRMESRNARCKCPNTWRKPYLEDVSILTPSPPIRIPSALPASSLWPAGFLPLCHSQPTAKHLKPQNPEANNCCSLLGFRTRPQIHPYYKSPHQNSQSWSGLWTSWPKAPQHMKGTPREKWSGLYTVLAEIINRMPLKQKDLKSIFRIQWEWNVRFGHFCKYLNFSLRIAAWSEGPGILSLI